MKMTINNLNYESYVDEECEDSITIEVTRLDGEFVCQYDIIFEGNEVVDYSGIAELDSDDIAFIRALGFNTNEVETE
ncbi:MAG: hypothetical protein SNH27_10320 [Rikenellaceae bacterium]